MVAVRSTLLAAAVTLLAAGCAKKVSSGPAVGVSDAHTIGMAAPDDSKDVLAATENAELRVRLDKDLGHIASREGDRFTARVLAPLVGKNGKIVVPAEATVHGHVVHVAELDRRIEVRFDQIATPEVNYTLDADVPRIDSPSATVVEPPAGTPAAVTTVTFEGKPNATGGGPREGTNCPDPKPAEVSADGVILPAGSELQLVLREPLAVATSSVPSRKAAAE